MKGTAIALGDPAAKLWKIRATYSGPWQSALNGCANIPLQLADHAMLPYMAIGTAVAALDAAKLFVNYRASKNYGTVGAF
jgi:hypothetical protein